MTPILTSALYPVAFLLVLSVVVVIHEWGHFIIARRCGVKVDSFSFGFGKTIWSRFDKKGTEWKISVLPLGGYVKMSGDADASSARADEKAQEMTDEEKKVAFPFQPVWKKLAIIFAGPAMNYAFSIICMTVLFAVFGTYAIPPVAETVMKDSAAEKAGILPNDRFLTINGVEMKDFTDIRRIVQLDNDLHIVLERDGAVIEKDVTLSRDNGGGLLGITASAPEETMKKLSVPEAFVESVRETWHLTVDTVALLKRIVTGKRSTEEMRGPLGIAEASGDAMRSGFFVFFLFIVQVSVAIGFVNLLPVPVLDGGQIVMYAIEGISGRPLNEKMQNIALVAGVILLLSLLVLTSWNDIGRIAQRILG